MIENNLLKTNFLGKDGFRWWIGQVAPEKAQGNQINQIGNTWGCRMKVRIFGYHPADITELPDEDLPWAQILLSSQGGSGKANRARSIRISPGDTVMGFFLDGDDAQLPVILGIFANTGYYASSEEYKSPFEPFTGYTSKIKPNNEFIAKNEGGDDSNKSQKSPRFLTKEIVEDLNENLEKGKAKLEQLVNSEELQSGIADATSELNQVLNSGALQSGLKNTAANAKPIIENLKKQFENIDTQAFKAIGQEIILGSGIQAAANNTKSTNKIKNTLKNTLSEVKNSIPKDKFKGLANGAKQIVSASKPMIKDMVNTTFDELAPQLNGGLNNLYKDKFGEVMKKTGNLALAKKAGQAAQLAMVGPVLNIQNALPCAVKNITDKLTGDVANLLAEFTNNVDNFTDCIGDQFIGALFNDMIKGINNELGDAMKGVSNIFPSGDLEGLLRGKAEGLLGLASVFDDCDIPTADLGEKTNKWILGLGPASLNLENIAGKVLAIANFFVMLSSFLMQMFFWNILFGGMGRSRDNNGGAGAIFVLYIVTMIVYFIGQLLVLSLTRYREFGADFTGANLSEEPIQLASALKKISISSINLPTQDLRQFKTANAFMIIPALTSNDISKLMSTHPPVQERIKRLMELEKQSGF